MIVVCASCRAKFRVPDERVGPRGVKVRCSRCRHVFVVRREEPAEAEAAPAAAPPPLPGAEIDLEVDDASRRRRSGAGKGAFPDLFGAREAPSAAADPAPDDPFAAAGFVTSPGGDPFAAAGQDFAPSPPAAAEALAGAAGPGASPLPVTDLSDLAPPAPAVPPPLPASGHLSLEERTPPGRELPAFEPLPGAELLGGGPAPAPGPDEPSGLDVARESAPSAPDGPAPGAPGRPLPEAPSPRRPPPRRVPEAAGPTVPGPAPAGAAPALARRLLVNSFSLAAVLVVAAALLALLSGDGERSLSRPWRLLRGAAAPERPVLAVDVTNGLYETAGGGNVLFVRGRLEARSRVSGPVRVRAEILDGPSVVARAEGLGGAVPTPEELRAVTGAEAAERLRGELASRAAPRLDPGDSVPFLVAFPQVPPRLAELSFRVVVEAAATPGG